MGKILDAFSDEQLLVNAVAEKRTPIHQRYCEQVSEYHARLEEKLSDEQKELLEKLLNAMADDFNCDAHNRFVRGYSLGVLMATEVMEERDKFLIEGEDCLP